MTIGYLWCEIATKDLRAIQTDNNITLAGSRDHDSFTVKAFPTLETDHEKGNKTLAFPWSIFRTLSCHGDVGFQTTRVTQ